MAVGRMTKVIIITLTCNHSRFSKPFFIFVRLRFYCAVLCWYTPLPHPSHHRNPVLAFSQPLSLSRTQTCDDDRLAYKLQTLVYDILPSTTAIADHAIGLKNKNRQQQQKPTTKNCQLTNSFSMMPIRQ